MAYEPFDDFDAYRPRPEWYLGDPLGPHGLGHAARVLVWANLVGTVLKQAGTQLDLEVVRWAAVLHDVRRVDDGRDLGHGQRAQSWITENRSSLFSCLTEDQADRLAYCCLWHVPDDREAPSLTPEIICLKDGDGLDRVRTGDAQARYMRSQIARIVLPLAHTLFGLTRGDRKDPWQAVSVAMRRLNVAIAGAATVSVGPVLQGRCLAC